MRQLEFKNPTARSVAVSITVIPLLLVALTTSAKAQQSPPQGCHAVEKREYDSAKKQKLLYGRFGYYRRTGRILRRYYWYCAPGH